MMFQRILLKISGEALSAAGEPLCNQTIDRTADRIAALHARGVEIGVVCGGGNIIRGRDAGAHDRNRTDHMGMLATAINALALQDALERRQVPCRVLSAVDMLRFCEAFSAREANRLIGEKTVVIFACGTGSPFFSTDTAAALRAAEIGADALLLAKNVDGLYSADPKTCADAVRYRHVSYDKVIRDNLRATDLTAITLCREQGIPILLFPLDAITDVFDGADIGTLIDERE